MGDLDLMKIADKEKHEFYSLGFKDAELGRKLSDADCFILSEAKRIVHTHLIEINSLTEDYYAKLKTKKVDKWLLIIMIAQKKTLTKH